MMRSSRLWGLIFVSIALIGMAIVPVFGQDFSDIEVTPTRYLSPTPLPAGCESPMALSVGSLVNTRPGIYLRGQPSMSGPIADYIGDRITFRVTGNSVCADYVNWWPVRGPSNYNPGWIAEREFHGGRYLLFAAAPPAPETLCAEPLNLVPGNTIPIYTGVRVRAEAGLSGLVLTVAPPESEVLVVGGPMCADRLNWWRVQVPVSGVLYEGWMAEGYGGAPWMEDPTVPSLAQGNLCGPSKIRIGVGIRGEVQYPRGAEPRNLRAAPGAESALLYTLIDGIAFDIISGPVCADNLNWWEIRLVARPEVTGWLAEGGPGNYWMRRIYTEPLR